MAGLIGSQYGPRVGSAVARQRSTSFWTVTTYLINASLFVLVGMELNSVVRSLDGSQLRTGIIGVVVVFAVLVVVRYLFLVAAAYTIRLLDRGPSQRLRRVTNRARVVSTMAGFRGAVSLAVALSVPETLSSGDAFPDRDLIIFITVGVVATTLVVQGLLFAPTIRWARLPVDDGVASEQQLAEITACEDAIAAISPTAEQLGVDTAVADRVRTEYDEHLTVLRARGNPSDAADDATVQFDDEYAELRLTLIGYKRRTMIRLRDQGDIDDTVLRRVQARLDVEELRLGGVDIE
ncbi:cation:proton antiporter [Gordonia sp. Z-3]|uniref:cation:proton antiporter domain-containing protein n=1 Tax=Gordonia sp. Z-3 TaxID=3115408 RepID=UPI002E2AC4D2|nr:cation:proton antiporter [Gordonia sp. Z-3]MED5802750.1 cation:proton antiporter [Gordonia sp. Z-3]